MARASAAAAEARLSEKDGRREDRREDVAAANPETVAQLRAAEDRAMGCVRASLELGAVRVQKVLKTADREAAFEVELPAGPALLLTTLRREDGKEHGAYFAEVERID